MNGRQLERIYLENGLEKMQLRNEYDLVKIHGIDYSEVDGFNKLSQENKEAFKNFIPKFYNGWGLNARVTIIPQSISYVEEVEYSYSSEDRNNGTYLSHAGSSIWKIHSNGERTMISNVFDDEEVGSDLSLSPSTPKRYLKFEYTIYDSRNLEWLHVLKNGTEWY